MPTHVRLETGLCGGSMVLAQIQTVSKDRMLRCLGSLDSAVMGKIREAVRVSLGLGG